jgi:hypothetical protein
MTPRLLIGALAFALALPVHAEPAKGTVVLGTRNATLAHAWLVVGPDAVDPKKTIRRVVFSATDIGAKLKACAKMSCTDGSVDEGMTIDLDNGPRINYWVALNGQRVQHSGTLEPKALAASASDDKRVAGKLAFDQSGAGGAKVDIQFDAPLAKRFDKP